ncbi:MAG TPA: universal stress protein [Thermodesulfovibrionales bacterium]|nr:universal stress protein [Thermodesulfovibrionales bacterium]
MIETRICPLTGLKTILLATDGSEYSEAALREAINLAKACSTKLYVLSVVEVNPEYATMAPQIVEKAEEETRRLLASVKEYAAGEGIECETIVHEGEEPYEFIVEEAEKKHVDMIVMGRHGRRGLQRLLMGSVTSKVIGHTPCSVLVVKA